LFLFLIALCHCRQLDTGLELNQGQQAVFDGIIASIEKQQQCRLTGEYCAPHVEFCSGVGELTKFFRNLGIH